MIRRRRPNREIQFSFDSFLDVVANVVGIILRLILVAWVGARSYKGPPLPDLPVPPTLEETKSLPDPHDPMADELEQQRALLSQDQAHLLEQLQAWKDKHKERETVAGEFPGLASERLLLEAERDQLLAQEKELRNQSAQQLELSMSQFRERSRKIIEEIAALKKKPSPKQALRYRTPVSQPLQTEELQLECQQGRVTVLDVGALYEEMQRGFQARADQVRTTGALTDTTPPVGAFRLHYVIERIRDPLAADRDQYSVSWEAWPVRPDRGETGEQALKAGSEFRRLLDNLDPNLTAVTFWVYPDSFALYRKLRDYLHERDVVVAGRPIMEGMLIGASPKGTASRGQ